MNQFVPVPNVSCFGQKCQQNEYNVKKTFRIGLDSATADLHS